MFNAPLFLNQSAHVFGCRRESGYTRCIGYRRYISEGGPGHPAYLYRCVTLPGWFFGRDRSDAIIDPGICEVLSFRGLIKVDFLQVCLPFNRLQVSG